MKVSRLAWVGLLLALGAALSIVWFVNVVHRGTGALVLCLGLLSIGLVSTSSLCLLFALARLIQARYPGSKSTKAQTAVSIEGEYVAKYSWSDRGIALAIAVCLCGLTAVFWLQSAKPLVTALSALMFVWASYNVAHITGTRIRFTRHGFIARISWLGNLSEPYDGIQRISGVPGTIKIQFSDGRSLKFHSGLGDPDVVIARLKAQCPELVHLGD